MIVFMEIVSLTTKIYKTGQGGRWLTCYHYRDPYEYSCIETRKERERDSRSRESKLQNKGCNK